MSSHWGWTRFTGMGALALMAATCAANAGMGQNLVVNGDFESGNSGFTSGYSSGDVSVPGGYSIGPNPSTAPGAFADWCNCGDHTTGTGAMMIVNGATDASLPIWEETVHVAASTDYTFSYWGAEVDHDSSSFPHVALKINGRVVGSGEFPEYSPDNGGHWQNYTFTWNSGSSESADLVLFDQNADSPWNDFALDDIRFSAIPGSGGGAAPASAGASSSGPITTHAQVVVKDLQNVAIALKPEERIAVMFLEAISSMEDDCHRHLNRRCSMAELVAGPNSPDWNIGRLKYNPARDPNYKYTITMTGTGFQVNAAPQRAGLGGFFVDGNRGMIPDTYYRANGPATAKDVQLGEISVSGEIFQVH
ncbi:MAG: hypothetical protein WBE72_08765 [Terracidiphilus sp.]